MVNHVIERLTADRHAQLFHPREVALAQTTRIMTLGEHYLSTRTLCRTPMTHSPLQRANLPLLVSVRVSTLQVLEKRLRFEPRIDLKKL